MDTEPKVTTADPSAQAESPAWAEKLLDEYHSAIFHFSVGAFPQRAVERIKNARKALLQALTVPKVADEADDFPTVRDQFAMAAPDEIPEWFEHHMPPRPAEVYPAGEHDPFDPPTNSKEIAAWIGESYRQRRAQWPWYYADMMMTARGAK